MAEKEYIERGALIEKMFPIGMPNNGKYPINAKAVRTAIEQVPAADVVEVRHGEWKLMGTEMFMDGSYASKFCCSLCAREIGVCHEHDNDKYKYAKSLYPYCHCGAKMDGIRKEQK